MQIKQQNHVCKYPHKTQNMYKILPFLHVEIVKLRLMPNFLVMGYRGALISFEKLSIYLRTYTTEPHLFQ